jgi:phosphoribosylamine--glycine ligase
LANYGEVGLSGGVLVTSGVSGYTLVVTGTGKTIAAARDAAKALAGKIVIPNARYRGDIGQRLIQEEFVKLQAWGILDFD